jgi:hypothetical protein
LAEKSVLDGKVVLLVPVSFDLMSEEIMRTKYPAEQRPTIVYTNESGSVNVALNYTDTPLTIGQLPETHHAVESMFQNLYPSAEWFRSDLVEINGHPFALLDLRTPAVDTEIRNIMVMTPLEGQQLLVSFNTVSELEDEWVPIGNQIIDTIEIID